MATDNIAPKGEERPRDDAELLNTEARVLAYLRAAMLESGDDPKAMAIAIKIVEAARARLQRKDPLRITSSAFEVSRLTAKGSS
jgi:hypothetical protein